MLRQNDRPWVYVMKVRILKSSELKEGCWSPLRYLDECSQCDKCFYCQHDEGAAGRLIRRQRQVEKLKEKIIEIEKRGDGKISRRRSEAGRGMGRKNISLTY